MCMVIIMLCEICAKNHATTVVTKTIGGKTSTTHVCAECALKAGYANLFGNFTLNHFITQEQKQEEEGQRRCSVCNSSFGEILALGRLGCSQCYKDFEQELLPTIENLHGNTYHVGKFPQGYVKKPDVSDLKRKMEFAVLEQDFETAARIRDEIKSIEGGK